jgi:PEP-CTERM motif
MKFSSIKFVGVALIALLATGAAQASPVYRWVDAGSGDTVGFRALADNGNLLLSLADSCGLSAVRQYNSAAGTYSGRQFVYGLPNENSGRFGAECGVFVDNINSAGDMVGTSLRNGVYIPTFWRGGVAFDLRDPANSGLVFTPDPYAVSAYGVDLRNLEINDPTPAMVAFGLKALWTNALGMYGTQLNGQFDTGYVLIPVAAAVPEPSTVMLVAGALAALVASRRSARLKG